jgi:hypothetical protein
MSKTYKLVNPYVSGKFNKDFKAESSLKAADYAYQSLSKHFSNSLPVFHFTLQQVSDKQVGGGKNSDYKHFKVTEKKKNNNGQIECKYKITPEKANNDHLNKFKTKISSFNNQKGGLDYVDVFSDDDDDLDNESDDDSEYLYTPSYMSSLSPFIYTDNYVYRNPITYYYYDPFVYINPKVYVPTFVTPLRPYIEIDIYKY